VSAWIGGRGGKSGPVVVGLVLLAMVQVGAIVVSASRTTARPGTRPPDLALGDAIPEVRGRDSLSRILSVPLQRSSPGWTVLLAFSPTCAWCDSVAPRWRIWTRNVENRAHLVGIASADPSAALTYVHGHGWKLGDLIVVDSGLTGVLGRQLTRKTPWLFLFDSTGALRYSGHGNEVGTIDSLLGISR